jgi:hypothetical protein
MKTKSVGVKHKAKLVATIEVPIYESLSEMTAELGEPKVLALANKQNVIQLQATERNQHSEGPMGKQSRRELAYSLMTTEEAVAFQGKFAELQKHLDSPAMQLKVDQYLAENLSVETKVALE